MRAQIVVFFFLFSFIHGDKLWFRSCDKCTYCKFLWTKASALNVNVMFFCFFVCKAEDDIFTIVVCNL